MFTVIVPGKPKPMDRPRVALHGFRSSGRKERNAVWRPDAPPKPVGAHVYVPKATLEYEKLVASEAVGQGVRRLEGPVGIEAEFYVLASEARGGPDVDNLLKTAFDGLNGVAFNDDSQIEYVSAKKFHVQDKTGLKAVLRIGRLEEFDVNERRGDS